MNSVVEESRVRASFREHGIGFCAASFVQSDATTGRGERCGIVVQVCAIEGRELWVGRLVQPTHELPRLPTRLSVIGEPIDGAHDMRYLVREGYAAASDPDDAYVTTLRRLLADPVMRHLAASLASTLAEPAAADIPFAEFAVSAIQAYVASRLTFARSAARKRGGLAPWQQRRASELLLARIGRHVPITELAATCRLSVSHFVRAFRQSTGLPPHQWIVMRRVNLSKDLLVEGTARPLAEIALACGFADQSHFTRTFSRIVGMTPGAWRRCAARAAQVDGPSKLLQ